MQNQEMNGLSQVAKDLENSCSELDRKITDLKNKSGCGKIFIVEFYDGDDSWTRVVEAFVDRHDAIARFNSLIPIVFKCDIEHLWLAKFDWANTGEYRSNDFELSHDIYGDYIHNKKSLWEEPSKWYPKDMRKAYSPNWYSELTMREIEVGNCIIDEPKRFF